MPRIAVSDANEPHRPAPRQQTRVREPLCSSTRHRNETVKPVKLRRPTMASCDPFDVHFAGDAQGLYDKIAALIHQHGGTISGDTSHGSVSVPVPVFGTVEATYSVSGQTCTIHVTQRSFFLPCGTIESFVKGHVPTVEETPLAAL
jgi:hypothetical protein